MSSRLTTLSAGALVAVMLLVALAPAHAKPVTEFELGGTEATLTYGTRLVGR